MIRPFLLRYQDVAAAGEVPAPSARLGHPWRVVLYHRDEDQYLMQTIYDPKEEYPEFTSLVHTYVPEGVTPLNAAVKVATARGLRIAGTELKLVWIDANDHGSTVRNFLYEIKISNKPYHRDQQPELKQCMYGSIEDLNVFDPLTRHAFEMMELQRAMTLGTEMIERVKNLDAFY